MTFTKPGLSVCASSHEPPHGPTAEQTPVKPGGDGAPRASVTPMGPRGGGSNAEVNSDHPVFMGPASEQGLALTL